VAQPTLTPRAFAQKWGDNETKEKAASQEHFIDLCRMLSEPTPNEADPTGSIYAFEKAVSKSTGGDGFADVWKKDFFGWEYKGKGKSLKVAYLQLLGYREDLSNPPLLVVSDLDTIEIRTNFTGLSPKLYTVTLDDLAADDPSEALATLRALFTAPEELRPRIEPAQITEKAARTFAELARSLQGRGHDPQDVAHFLDRILFMLFAEDAGLLPKNIMSRLSTASHGKSDVFSRSLGELFSKMSRDGGLFGTEEIDWFNGGLFDTGDVIPLTGTEITTLLDVSKLNWALIEPAIFGTLFERGLDPEQRAQLGAHYTDRDAIWGLVEPVILRPLRREYADMQSTVTQLLLSGKKITKATRPEENPQGVFRAFLDRLRRVRVLDPACGSGNFLIVSLWALKDLEWEAIQWGSLVLQTSQEFPHIGPEAVLGIELNAYAAELARVTIWIGEIQWMIRHGLGYRRDPILKSLNHIENRDALLDVTDPSKPQEARWPEAEFIVGNPPFLGNRLLRRNLGDAYSEALWSVFDARLPRSSDLCCYFHEKARAHIQAGRTRRAGLLATQGIRGQANRRVLERIRKSGSIFFARSDEHWVLAGANVHISFVGQDNGSDPDRTLDGLPVTRINADLTSGLDLTSATRLQENAGLSFMGVVAVGPFDIPESEANRMLASPNPHGESNAAVLRRLMNGEDITGRPRHRWIIDFAGRTQEEAALFEAPFEYVQTVVRPKRIGSGSEPREPRWWLFVWPRPEMRAAIRRLRRYVATPLTSKHRLFVWVDPNTLVNHAVGAIARDDDYTLGVLQSRAHELWARGTGTQLREVESGFRYTPTTTFETFPFPHPTDEQRERVGEAASRLVELRDGWLNPPGLDAADLEKRTLTNLYNQRPTWLDHAHATLDSAVFAAYNWPADLVDSEILERLLTLNFERVVVDPR
jgi:hypothetical protein